MASETELLNSTGLVVMLRDPNTGEVMHLNFPPGTYEIPLEAHLPARVAKVTLYAERRPRGGEYDVRLRFDTNPSTQSTDTREVQVSNSRKDTAPPPSAHPVVGPPVTSVIAPPPPEVTPVIPLQVEPSTGAPETPQAPSQAPSQGASGGVDAPKAPSPPTEAQKGSPKVTGAGGRRGL
jgi:hypothetical protein